MAPDDKPGIDLPAPPTDPALPGPDAPTEAKRTGKPDASFGLRVNMRAYEESPTSAAPTLDALESIIEGFLAANYPGHTFTVKGERLDK